MKKLLYIEWLKLKNYRTFWVIISLIGLGIPLLNLFILDFLKFSNVSSAVKLPAVYGFPDVWQNISYISSFLTFFACFLIIVLTVNEFNFRTHRQHIIDGLTRKQFLHSKVGLIILLSLAITCYTFFTGLVFGFSESIGTANWFDKIKYIPYLFLLNLNYVGLAFLFALVIKKSGLALITFSFYAIFFENIVVQYYGNTIVKYLPLQCSDELIPFKVTQTLKALTGIQTNFISDFSLIIATLIYLSVYYILSLKLLTKRDW